MVSCTASGFWLDLFLEWLSHFSPCWKFLFSSAFSIWCSDVCYKFSAQDYGYEYMFVLSEHLCGSSFWFRCTSDLAEAVWRHSEVGDQSRGKLINFRNLAFVADTIFCEAFSSLSKAGHLWKSHISESCILRLGRSIKEISSYFVIFSRFQSLRVQAPLFFWSIILCTIDVYFLFSLTYHDQYSRRFQTPRTDHVCIHFLLLGSSDCNLSMWLNAMGIFMLKFAFSFDLVNSMFRLVSMTNNAIGFSEFSVSHSKNFSSATWQTPTSLLMMRC